jgi:hypothetical protein
VNLRDADLRFLLPEAPLSVSFLEASQETKEAWQAAGIRVLEPSATAAPDVVIASASRLRDAVERHAPMVVLNGRASRRRLAASGYCGAHLLTLPSPRAPRLVVPIKSRVALAGALSPVGRRRVSAATARRAVGRIILRLGWAPGRAVVTVAARDTPRPWLVGQVARTAEVPCPNDWYLWLGEGDPLQRAVLHIAAPEGGGWALKFSRVTGNTTPFEQDELASRAAKRLPGRLASHIPRVVTRGTDAGLPFLVETRFSGRSLTEILQSSWSASRRLRYVEPVADWLRDVALATQTEPAALAAERERLARAVAPARIDAGVMTEVMSAIEHVPGVLVHNDPGTWNVVIDRRGHFGVVDWESSRETGMPLWDLTYFLADALTLIEHRRFANRTAAILKLFRGESTHSELLFRRVRETASELGVAAHAVGPLVSLGWLHHAQSPEQRRTRLRNAGADVDTDRGVLSLIAKPWLEDPALGFGWKLWQ